MSTLTDRAGGVVASGSPNTTDRRLGVFSGLAIKVPCVAATTANITLAGEQTIDGRACVTGERVLVKDQSTTSQNGPYDVATGNWTRTADFDSVNEITTGTLVYVTGGTANSDTLWEQSSSAPDTIDVDPITFANTRTLMGLPTSSTDNAIARYDGTTGDLQNSGVLIDDSSNITPASSGVGGLGTALKLWASLYLTTLAQVPLITGGAAAASTLTLQSTSSGSATTDMIRIRAGQSIANPSLVLTPVSGRIASVTTIDTYGNWFITAGNTTTTLGSPYDPLHPFYAVGQPAGSSDPDKPPGNVFSIVANVDSTLHAFNTLNVSVYSSGTNTHGHYAAQFTGYAGTGSSGSGGAGFSYYSDVAAAVGHAIVAQCASSVVPSGGDIGAIQASVGQHGATPRTCNYFYDMLSRAAGNSCDFGIRIQGNACIAATGSILGLHSDTRLSCAWGIDFNPNSGTTDATFSGGALRSKGFTVDGNGRLTMLSGTQAAPALLLGTDTASGIYQPLANTFAVSISNNAELLISSSGVALGHALGVAYGGTGDTGTAWTTYTPTVTAGTGTFTTLGTVAGAYKIIGKTCFIRINIPITTNGTAATDVRATLPGGLTSQAQIVFNGREKNSTGKQLQGLVTGGGTNVIIYNYDGSYPGGTGFELIVSGVIEIQ